MKEDFDKIIDDYLRICKEKALWQEEYCIYEMYPGNFAWYKQVAEIARSLNIKTIYDVGANIGVQRYFFERYNIKYVPIDMEKMENINGSLDGLIYQKYPFKINNNEKDMLVSGLCIGFLIKDEVVLPYLKDFKYIVNSVEINGLEDQYNLEIFRDDSHESLCLYSKI